MYCKNHQVSNGHRNYNHVLLFFNSELAQLNNRFNTDRSVCMRVNVDIHMCVRYGIHVDS